MEQINVRKTSIHYAAKPWNPQKPEDKKCRSCTETGDLLHLPRIHEGTKNISEKGRTY
jgi:hypothetical protein